MADFFLCLPVNIIVIIAAPHYKWLRIHRLLPASQFFTSPGALLNSFEDKMGYQGKSWQEVPRPVHIYETKNLRLYCSEFTNQERKKGPITPGPVPVAPECRLQMST